MSNLIVHTPSVAAQNLGDSLISVAVVLSGSVFKFDGGTDSKPFLSLTKGMIYRFDMSDSSLATGGNNKLQFSTTSDGTHNSGSVYSTGVTDNYATINPGNPGCFIQIHTHFSTPDVLHYFNSLTSDCGNEMHFATVGSAIVENNGQVGIGVTSPSRKLDVNGDLKVRGGDILGSHASNKAIEIDSTSNVNFPYDVTVDGVFINQPIAVTVASSKFYLDGSLQVTGNLTKGTTYRFDVSDGTNSTHALAFSTDASNSTPYTTGVTTVGTAGTSGAYVQIVTNQATPSVLYYYCSSSGHSGMGGQLNFGSTPYEPVILTPGSYTNSDITVNSSGAISAISTGSGGGGGGGLSITTATFTFDYNNSIWATMNSGSTNTTYSWDTGVDIPANALIVDIHCEVTTAFNNGGGYSTSGPYLVKSSGQFLAFDGYAQGSYGYSGYYGKCLQYVGLSAMQGSYRNGGSVLDLNLSLQRSSWSGVPTQGAASFTVYYLS